MEESDEDNYISPLDVLKQDLTQDNIEVFFETLAKMEWSQRDILDDIYEVEQLLLKHKFDSAYTSFRCWAEFYYGDGLITTDFKRGWMDQFPHRYLMSKEEIRKFTDFFLPARIAGFVRLSDDLEDMTILKHLYVCAVGFYCEDNGDDMAHCESDYWNCDCKETRFVKDLIFASCSKYSWIRENYNGKE